ncbi:BrnT family toxin [Pseudoxanthomonas spadix]|nr:BrnT family toxin [Pseudoxanthomonas spadix]MBP3975833.1 BrnT family toxin [Pseudoxanthomonas spadix]RMW92984.1 BrnT family toxin [Pseudoxanthomonas spadix]
MEIEFDPAKNERNIAERGISFDQASQFDFSTARIVEDTRQNYPERRFQALGLLADRLYMLVFAPIAGGIRVISLRKANKREVRRYEQTP